jgi:hypothetical protein
MDKKAAMRHFRDKKWGPAQAVAELSENKFSVHYEGRTSDVYGWELNKIKKH